MHLKGVVPGRDFPLENVHDVRNADAGDPCPRCGKALQITAGLEIGHVFKLGTKYSKSMGATYLDEKGNEVHVIMGCYGIGINRIVAGAVEAAHDANGIIWPLALAPYHVVVVPLQVQNAAVMEHALALEKALAARRARCAGRRPRPAAGREVQGRGLDRGSAAGRGGRARAEGRHDRNQVAQPVGGEARPGGIGRRGDRRRARRRPASGMMRSASSGARPARPRGDHEHETQRLPRLPYVLLGAMTLVSFGGPFVILGPSAGGRSAKWPPDRPVEWVAIAVVIGLVIALFVACVSIGWWHRQASPVDEPKIGDFHS